MLFNSVEFVVFFTAVFLLYFTTPHKWRWLLLLIASYIFYMSWKVEYILLIVVSTLVDYFMGIKMGQEVLKEKRKKFLYISLVSNLSILFSFKYFNFFSESVGGLANVMGLTYSAPLFEVLLPVGISFYTFQTLSYSIDVYNGKIDPEKHLGRFALFVSFFPQLVAGPIERSGNLLPQFREKKSFDYDRVMSGMRLAAWGLFKKVVIADRLAFFVNMIYNSPENFHGLSVALATFFFAFQIYCDFSGYSDIAIGVARMLGFDLMKNFERPYFSRSIGEFWRRWHISLSTWFRDYVYIPLGGNRVVKWRWYYNLFMTFLISGLWHGANWTFVIWGALHGFYLIVENFSKGYMKEKELSNPLPKIVKDAFSLSITFALVCFAWIFFRANSLSDALLLIQNLFVWVPGDIGWIFRPEHRFEIVLSFLAIGLLLTVQVFQEKRSMGTWISIQPLFVRWAVYVMLVSIILNFGEFNQQQFIYFQF
ncbi:MAG: MBOAT family protein [Bacteroidia bacterium]|nr:MBOAT family protein [Bacteroidia bacterium]